MKILKWLNPRNWFSRPIDVGGGTSGIDLFGSRTKSGLVITPENALKVPVVFSCVKVLSDSISNLPLRVYEEKGGIKIVSDATDHEFRRFKRPNQFMGINDLKKFFAPRK